MSENLKIASKKANTESATVEFAFGYDAARKEYGTRGVVKYDLTELTDSVDTLPHLREHAPMILQLALHGAIQKGGDSYSGAAEESDPVGWAMSACFAVWEALKLGEWSSRSTTTIFEEALQLASASEGIDKSIEECRAAIAALSEKQQKALRKQIAPFIKRVELMRAQAKRAKAPKEQGIDLGSLFAADEEAEASEEA